MSGLTRTKRLRYRSTKKARELREGEVVVAAVFERDGGCILRSTSVAGPCFGESFTPHHIRKEGQGGKRTAANLVTLCSHHNEWVESNRRPAERLGLVVRRDDELRQAWRDMRLHGLAVGPLVIECAGPRHTPIRRIVASEAECLECGVFFWVVANPDGGPGGILAPHEAIW